jgi:hypothetical protein
MPKGVPGTKSFLCGPPAPPPVSDPRRHSRLSATDGLRARPRSAVAAHDDRARPRLRVACRRSSPV